MKLISRGLRYLFHVAKNEPRDWKFGRTRVLHFAQDRLVFINIPKTGTTSMRRVLAGKYLQEAPEDPSLALRAWWVRKSAQPRLLNRDDIFSFAVVRNPYQRLVSLYTPGYRPWYHIKSAFYFLWDRLKYGLRQRANYDRSFVRFATLVCSIKDEASDAHFKGQSAQLLYDGKIVATKILKFENLQDDFEPIRARYELSPLPKLNTSVGKKNYYDYYDEALAERVYQRYQRDFELWYPNARAELMAYLDGKGE